MECVRQTISGAANINETSTSQGTVTVSRNGDLIHQVWVRCNQNSSDGISGDHLIEDVEVEIGGQRIDKHTLEWNQIWRELTTPESQIKGYKYLTGGYSNTLITKGGTNQQSIMVPLNFWFCRDIGLSLPLIALQYHEVKLKITWGSGSASGGLSRSGANSVTPECEVWVDYIYLDTDERRRFAQVSHEYLIEQLQYQNEGESKEIYRLNFEHPVKELLWTTPTSSVEANTIISQKVRLEINGHDRFTEQTKEYFQIKQPLQHHTSVPGYNIKETESPTLLTSPILICAGTDNAQSGTPNADGEFQVLASATSNLKIYTATANPIKVGDILKLSTPVLEATGSLANGDESISYLANVLDIVTAAANNAVAVYTIGFTSGFDNGLTTNTPVATIAGAGSVEIIARIQYPISRCSQLMRDINVFSFAINPEEHQPSGTCNFSRIDHAKLILSSAGTISNIYVVNYNVLRIMSGMAGLAYAN